MDTLTQPGSVLLGRYRVERVLGRGGMGIVVAARHLELGQLHAIKFLLPSMLEHSEIVERFLREARAAAKLHSDHVVRVSDVGRLPDGAPYMVMEYLEGRDLKALLVRDGPLPVLDVVAYVLQVCDAIAEAHGAGIIHRDLKPANLFLVHRRGRAPCVKVLDFGISKHTGAEEVDLTNTNVSLGSPLYMSPEQMSKFRKVDVRADIWALGVILYELLSGQSPFYGGSVMEVTARVLQDEPTPLRELRPEVPDALDAIVMRCLRKQRDDRFANVEQLQAALQALFPHEATSRSSLSSVTNEATTTAISSSVVSSPGISVQPSEPTTITFGQTGKPKLSAKRPSLFLFGAAIVAVAVVGGVTFLRRTSTAEQAAQASASATPTLTMSSDAPVTGASAGPAPGVVPDAPLSTRSDPVLEDKPAPLVQVPTVKPVVLKPAPQEAPKPALPSETKTSGGTKAPVPKSTAKDALPDNPF